MGAQASPRRRRGVTGLGGGAAASGSGPHLNGLQRRSLAGTIASHASQCVVCMRRPQATPKLQNMVPSSALRGCSGLLGRCQMIGCLQHEADRKQSPNSTLCIGLRRSGATGAAAECCLTLPHLQCLICSFQHCPHLFLPARQVREAVNSKWWTIGDHAPSGSRQLPMGQAGA